jgi:holo-[acyl-carrier protein] synthase
MIAGVGVDLLDINRVSTLYDRYDKRFVTHLLTDRERVEFESTARKVHYLATRFSGKEAISKALGTGLRAPMTLHAVSILNDNVGKPYLVYSEDLSLLMQDRAIQRIHLSFSHENHMLLSHAIAES